MRNLLFLLFFFTTISFAQPGGGGGISINKIYDEQGNSIDTSDINIRIFFLLDGKIEREYFPKPGYMSYGLIYVPPLTAIDWQESPRKTNNYRLLLTYKKNQHMVVDFLEVMGANAGGSVDKLDSLQFLKGEHISYYRDMFRFRDEYPKEFEQLRKAMLSGLTKNQLLKLSAKGIITQKKANISIFKEDKLPYTFFLYRAQHYVSVKDSSKALADIEKMLALRKGVKNCAINYLLADAYILVKRYPEAVTALSEALHCKRYHFDHFNKEDNFRRRALLYVEMGEFEEALEDYNMLVKVAENPFGANIERANFKIRYLGKITSAISDLKADINKIPEEDFNGRTEGWLYYSNTFFALGNAYYANKDSTAAFKSWLTAMELGFSAPSSANIAIEHFDSLIIKHPSEPMLYLSRALAHTFQSPYLGGGDNTKKALRRALDDLEIFGKLNPSDIRYHLQRSQVLCLLKEGQAALDAANAAIAMNPNDPRGFMKRYGSRRELGKVIWGNKNDEDYVKYTALLKSWKYVPN